MQLHDLQPNVGAKHRKKRVGRGISAGQGKTAGRGTKGQGARKSGGVRPGFEGGQNPVVKSMPKLPGFTSHRPKVYNVNTGQLEAFDGKTVDNFSLAQAGLVPSPYVKVKLITKGDLTKKLAVKLQGASQSAIDAIQKAGGSFDKLPQVKREAKPKTEDDKPAKKAAKK